MIWLFQKNHAFAKVTAITIMINKVNSNIFYFKYLDFKYIIINFAACLKTICTHSQIHQLSQDSEKEYANTG